MTSLQRNGCLIWPHIYTEGDKNPGIILTFPELLLITDSLVVSVCLERPTTVLSKTLLNLNEQQASLKWDATDLVTGFGQILTAFVTDLAGDKTTIFRMSIDVKAKPCP